MFRPRYIRQPHTYSCGPTAILNAMKWAGMPYSIVQDYDRLVDLCECDEGGTYFHQFDQALRNEVHGILKVRRKFRPTLKDVEDWVKKPDQAAIYLYWHLNKPEGHYALVTDRKFDGRRFEVVNDGPSRMLILRDQLKGKLARRRNAKSDLPTVWLLKGT